MFKKLLLMTGLVCATCLPAMAQKPPANEVVTGYTYLRGNELNTNFNGFNASYTRYLNNHVGLTAEIGANFTTGANTVTYLFGPQVTTDRNKRVSAFAHVLLGGGHINIEDEFGRNGFAMAIGGGIDIKINDKVSVRALQADYVPIRFDNGTIHNGRVGAGITFRF
ncbi:MAG: porin family protein [Blastocatellia bacterium]|nr:porin family protein [Blastocatellia bacterium]